MPQAIRLEPGAQDFRELGRPPAATRRLKHMRLPFRSFRRARLTAAGIAFLALTNACSGDNSGPSTSKAAGASAAGGIIANGGAMENGGAAAVGGQSSGGVATNGGATSPSNGGGSLQSGGADNGGNMATGGRATGGVATATAGTTTASGGRATGGAMATGGTTATGGSAAVAGARSGMRDITSMALVKEMKLGWNLGNTMDANPLETSWGNPKTTKAMIDVVKAGGFGTVRIPVTWNTHVGASPNYTVEAAWMARVEEIANYVLSNGMYAIVNTHHDEWVSVMPTANQATIADKLAKLWTQIATRFRDYDDHLVFETLNEPRTTDATEWTGGTAAARTLVNAYNLAAVNAIRATGGNNALRHIMIPTHAANASTTCVNALVIPNNDARIIVSLHTYYPNAISMGGATTWGTAAEKTAMATELDRIYNLLPARGRAVVIGEWGTIHQNNTAVRVDHAGTYAREVAARGMCPIWWDNGDNAVKGFAILDRKVTPAVWLFPDIANALATGATAGAAIAL
jgi:endoglucanase